MSHELGPAAVILLDAAVWLLLHGAAVAAAIRIPWERFAADGPVTRLRGFEAGGRWYERRLLVQRWKDRLPDGGGWVKAGFPKRRLRSGSREYLERFAAETRRGELTHWAMLLPLPLFALWNNAIGMIIMTIYALIANIPCILVQRYNRAPAESHVAAKPSMLF
ncbi:glycosyl-4,4'-diaponeurosporenoate acyltransferase [Paenibacillus sp. FSL W8-1187]|uniref:glycosyl-4,4'-diaponeurosporenoate acyltransferase CrtO family protein n=1 Tax=unclassified Paenibacillus TaxID=185978 RepID=UPI00129BFEE8|nr:glycosyl-4,4'-diaponeurosporenoate acyltransferase [Paenibacillus sp. B01]QGG56553.1 glycosyl-4,4'-diaponeurosporenoate acyltransferase [Paenibacillus sp. B01]